MAEQAQEETLPIPVARPLPPIDPRYTGYVSLWRGREINAINCKVSSKLVNVVGSDTVHLNDVTLIGAGTSGHSQVFRARWSIDEEEDEWERARDHFVAFKVTFREYPQDGLPERRQVKTPIKAWCELVNVDSREFDHPALLQITRIGWCHNQEPARFCWVTVMQHIDGHTLEAYIRTVGLPAGRLYTRMVEQLAAGVADLHSAAIVHGDIEPANVMLSADFTRTVLVDFDRAQRYEPNQAVDTKKADMLALGRTLLQARVSIQALAEAEARDPDATLQHLATQLLDPATRFDVPLQMLLAPNQAHRYTAAQFLEHWQRLMRD
jgi:serine/threonine protein kinase